MRNAIEHGSQYGERGEVHVKFLGGDNGAMVLIEDYGNGLNLQPLSSDEIEQIQSDLKGRGRGLAIFTETSRAIIGSEQDMKVFRLILLYPASE